MLYHRISTRGRLVPPSSAGVTMQNLAVLSPVPVSASHLTETRGLHVRARGGVRRGLLTDGAVWGGGRARVMYVNKWTGLKFWKGLDFGQAGRGKMASYPPVTADYREMVCEAVHAMDRDSEGNYWLQVMTTGGAGPAESDDRARGDRDGWVM